MGSLDFLLWIGIGLVYAAGFWCGKSYGSVGKMWDTGKTKAKEWLA